MPRPLFRKEAIDAQREKFLGETSVAQPVRMWVYTATACTIAVLAVVVAIWGQYTRRERVQGYLSSAVGAADVRMPDAGTVTEVLVKEGDVVTRGAPMARLAFDRSGINDASGDEAVSGELHKQVDLLTRDRAQTTRLGQQQVDQLRKRVASLQTEIREVDREAALQAERLAQSKKILDKWVGLRARDYASEYYVLQYENQVKDQEIKVQQLQRQRASSVMELGAAQADLPSAQLRAQAQVDQITQTISKTSQTIAEQRQVRERGVKRDMIVVAPIDGTVTNIGPVPGQTVAADAKFATVLPKDGALHAELLVPTRAIGFVHPGQAVTMRYEAFPYERFGQYAGKVESVGRTVWTQGDSVGPLSIREPVYRVVVDLDRQDIGSGDQRLPLRAGMVVSADLLMERRSLLEWLFQPVLQLRRRMGEAASAAP
ncbi:MAG: HlyD family efflux transporter periplasmic adaptor subunit [Burkholderiaceae bacterium]